jgi:DNA invertase Pin-like site-specific DNA recombinase
MESSGAPHPKRVGIYARLSLDDGTKESTQRQVADCEAYAGLREWTIADPPYVDRDLSGFSGVERPEFERMLRDLESGDLDGVVCWKFDRLTRRPRDLERVWSIVEDRGGVLASVTEFDTSTDAGPFMMRTIVGIAEMESKNTSRRVKRAKLQARTEGRPHHGGHRGFGHNRDGTPQDAEAALIQDAARRILSGAGVTTIAREWAERGITTPAGKAWAPTHLRRMLMQARLAGAREHSDGTWSASGAITPILDEATVRQLRNALSDPRRRTNHGRVNDALLTGILHCAECGSTLTTGKVRNRRMYGCRPRPDRPGCGRVSVSVALADAYIGESVLTALETPEVRAALDAPAGDRTTAVAAKLDADRVALERLAVDHYAHATISEAEYAAAREVLADRIAASETTLAKRTTSGQLRGVTDLRAEWARRDLDWRRQLVRLLVRSVRVDRARQPYNTWQPDRLSITPTYAAAD